MISSLINRVNLSYISKIILLAYIPTVVILIFTTIRFNNKYEDIKQIDELHNISYEVITQFYDLNYLHDERLFSLIYSLNPTKENKNILSSLVEISYDSLENDSVEMLKNFRNAISRNDIKSNEILYFYNDFINNYINKITYKYKNRTSNKKYNDLLNSYELIFKLSENYYSMFAVIFERSMTYKNELMILEVDRIKKNIDIQKTYVIPQLPFDVRRLIENTLSDDVFSKIDAYLAEVKNSKKFKISQEEIEKLDSDFKDTIYILNNEVASKIENLAQELKEKEYRNLTLFILLNLFVIILIHIFAIKLKNQIVNDIDEKMTEINNKNYEINNLYKYVDKYIIISKTDKKGFITYASKAFTDISKYEINELLNKPHNIIRHEDMPKSAFKDLWETITAGKTWEGEVKNKAKDGSIYWAKSRVEPTYDLDNNLIGYTSIRQDITMQKYAEYLNDRVTNLLNNANNGFLSFSKDMKIQDGYSKVSLQILSCDELKDKIISEVLFSEDKDKKEIFELGFQKILEADNELSKEILLTLLPNEGIVKNRIFSIKYKILKNDEFMVILDDITDKIALQNKIDYENKIQKMIVSIATRKREFLELKNDFFDFISDIKSISLFSKDIEENYLNITKQLHTFKGLFAQEEFVNITDALHNLESNLINLYEEKKLTNELLQNIIKTTKLKDEFNKDLDIVNNILGIDFLQSSNSIKIDSNVFKDYETKISEFIKNDKNFNEKDIRVLLKSFLDLNQKSLKALLSIYPPRIENIAKRLNKDIYPVEIIGDENITIRTGYQNFINNLVHVFRNMLDHGIESPQERVDKNKDEKGKIVCQFELLDSGFIKLTISDDGRGIDINLIKTKALKRGIISQEDMKKLSDEDIINLIFVDNFSTKDDDTNLISGRGIGLSSLYHELISIGGSVKIENRIDEGIKFIFQFPAYVNKLKIENENIIFTKNILNEQINSFLSNNPNIKINKFSESDYFDFRDYYSVIKLSTKTNELFIAISFNDKLLNEIIKIFIDQELDKNQMIEMYQSFCDETLNILLGNCLSEYNKYYEEVEISTLLSLDKKLINNFIKNNNSLFNKIETNFGSFDNLIISISKGK